MGAIEISNGTSAQALTHAPAREFSASEIDVIKSVIAKGATDAELKMFLLMAGKLGLDPISKQIHCVRRRVRQGDQYVESMTITVGIDGYRLVADRTGRYCPGRAPTYEYDDDGRVTSATAYVMKLAGGTWHEVAAVAFLEEYAQLGRDGKPTAMWARMPRLMLSKCAEALALRRAFPAELSGVYTEDEMANSDQRYAADGVITGVSPASDADATHWPAMGTSKPQPQPVIAAPDWKAEMIELGKRAVEASKTADETTAAALLAAAQAARTALTKNGHSTPEERALATGMLKRALGE